MDGANNVIYLLEKRTCQKQWNIERNYYIIGAKEDVDVLETQKLKLKGTK